MKQIFIIILLASLFFGCNESKKEGQPQQATVEEAEKAFPRPSFIIWIDKNKEKTLKGKLIRNVKARVHIDDLGKVTVLEYAKKPEYWVRDKISRQLVNYRVTPKYIEEGKVKVGENYVFLRFVEKDLEEAD